MSAENNFSYNQGPQTEYTFVNRAAELQTLLDAFEEASRKYTKRFITGFPGVGKNSLVRNFLKDLEIRTKAYFCVSLRGQTIEHLKTDSECFVQSFYATKQSPQNNINHPITWASFFGTFVDKLPAIDKITKDSTIIVLINGVEKETYVYAKALSDKLSTMKPILLLITSGISPEFGIRKEYICLERLDKTFSKELLESALQEWPGEDLDDICEVLSNFPLSLQQAISYINYMQRKEGSYTIGKYVEEMRNPNMVYQLVAYKLPWEPETSNSIVSSVNLTLGKLQADVHCGNLAVAMIQLLAWLDNFSVDEEEFIKITGLDELSGLKFEEGQKKRLNHQDALRLLDDYKLIERSEKNVNLANYNIVHIVIRIVFEKNKAKILNVLVKSHGIFQAYLKSPVFIEEVKNSAEEHLKSYKRLENGNKVDDKSVHEAFMLYIKHLQIFRPMKAIKKLQEKMQKLDDFSSEDFTEIKVDVLVHLGTLYKQTKRFGEEIVLREKLNKHFEDKQFEDVYVDNLLQLSKAYLELGHEPIAQKYCTSIVDNKETTNKAVKQEAKLLLNRLKSKVSHKD